MHSGGTEEPCIMWGPEYPRKGSSPSLSWNLGNICQSYSVGCSGDVAFCCQYFINLIRVNNEHSVSVCWSHYECIYQLAVGSLYCTLRTVVVYEIKSNMSAAGRVTAGLAESNGSRRHVCMCDVTLCKMCITKCVSYLPIKRQHAHGHHYQSPPK